jgi:hypothetical protein
MITLEALGLDPGIAEAVAVLRAAGVETFESCEGGEGHAFPEPTVRFGGDNPEGFRALAVAMRAQLPVAQLRRVWAIRDGEPTGPEWELVFYSETPPGPWVPVEHRNR